MDIHCPTCAEPYEIDYLHDVASGLGTTDAPATFASVYADFRRRGCLALGERHGTVLPMDDEARYRADARSMLADLLGDDVDGYASDVEDFGLDF